MSCRRALRGAMALTAGLTALVSAGGCVRGDGFETVDRGAYSGYGEAARLVVRTGEEWQALWRAHASRAVPAATRPTVDFQRELVLAVFMGTQPTGGYAIEVVSVMRTAGGLVARVQETVPPPGAMVSEALTAPYHIVRIPRTALPIRFEAD